MRFAASMNAVIYAATFSLGTLVAQQTTITLSTSANPAFFGQPVTLTATVTPASATGSVTFYDGGSVLGSKLLVSGQASLTTSLLPAGVRSLKAYFAGGGGFAAAASTIVAQTVNAGLVTGFQAAVNYSAGIGPDAFALGDFNGDGKVDLAVANNGGNISILLGNADGTFQTAVSYGASVNPLSLVLGDFNGERKSDLAVANYDGKVSIHLPATEMERSRPQ